MSDSEDPRFVEVYRARTSAQAHVVRNMLEEAGIAATIDNDLLQGVSGEVVMGWPTAPRILVEESQAARARSLIERQEPADVPEDEEERDEAVKCLACGEPLPEDADVCPACGWSYEDDEAEA
jgi:hypothetical protein